MISHKCQAGIKQISGTCYFNTALNALLLSDNFHNIILREWNRFFKDEGAYVKGSSEWANNKLFLSHKYYKDLLKITTTLQIEKLEPIARFRIARHAFHKVMQHALCEKPKSWMFRLSLRDEPKRVACSLLQTTKVGTLLQIAKGGDSLSAMKALLHSLYQDSYNKVRIVNITNPEWSKKPLDDTTEVCIFVRNESATLTKHPFGRFSSYGISEPIPDYLRVNIAQYMAEYPQMKLDHAAINVDVGGFRHSILGVICDGHPMIVDSDKLNKRANKPFEDEDWTQFEWGLNGIPLGYWGYPKCVNGDCTYAYICYVKEIHISDRSLKKSLCTLTQSESPRDL
jgi:hypothetical protein